LDSWGFLRKMKLLRPRQLVDTEVSTAIDLARGLAILLVVLVHTSQRFIGDSWGDPNPLMVAMRDIFLNGAAGVVLFFMISGFLMELLYGGREFDARKFWSRRIARIWPLWLFWSLVATIAANIPLLVSGVDTRILYGSGVELSSPNAWILLLLQLTLLGWLVPSVWQATPGGWSIQSEMANYVVYVPVQRMPIGWVFGIYGVLEILYILVRPFLTSALPTYEGIFDAALTSPLWFLLGVFLQRVRRLRLQKKPIPWQTWGTVTSATLIGMTMSGPYVSQAISMVVVLLCLGTALGLARWSRAQWLQTVGKYSYGMYFAHFLFLLPAGWLVAHALILFPNELRGALQVALFVPTYLLIIGLSMCVAFVSFRVLESPILVWARKRTAARPLMVQQSRR
jgi:peptidoglycan/LPS O-acetylase OafA/YrhL